MKIAYLLAGVTLLSTVQVQAQTAAPAPAQASAPASAAAKSTLPAKAILLDFSTASLIDGASAKAILGAGLPAKVWKVYPANKWGYVSQVEGGITSTGTCVITARVMMVPLTPTMKAVLFRPEQIATAFDAVAGATPDQCKQLARTKLGEAVRGVVSSLVKS
jgi:hypothetical protein